MGSKVKRIDWRPFLVGCDRVLGRFGHDQSTNWMVGENYVNVWETESCYVGDGRDYLLGALSSNFWPSLAERVRLLGGTLHWIRFIEPSLTS